MVRMGSDAENHAIADAPPDEEEREIQQEASGSGRDHIHTIKEEDGEESHPTTFVGEESKEQSKPEFAPMHSNPYAARKQRDNDGEEEPQFPGDQLVQFADKEAINKLIISSREGEIN